MCAAAPLPLRTALTALLVTTGASRGTGAGRLRPDCASPPPAVIATTAGRPPPRVQEPQPRAEFAAGWACRAWAAVLHSWALGRRRKAARSLWGCGAARGPRAGPAARAGAARRGATGRRPRRPPSRRRPDARGRRLRRATSGVHSAAAEGLRRARVRQMQCNRADETARGRAAPGRRPGWGRETDQVGGIGWALLVVWLRRRRGAPVLVCLA
jgi:hypothetical protein